VTATPPNPDAAATGADAEALRDIAEVPAVEVVTTVALHLMSAAAVKVGLGAPDDAADETDLDEARTLITALAGLITASAPRLGTFHAAPLRDGLRTLQLAFREASTVPDEPGRGPGEDLTGPVFPTAPRQG
jgi:CRISPR/Cas system-associated protein Csm6